MSCTKVDCRYTESNKRLIYNSRIDASRVLGLAINLCSHPPKIWLNASTATIYKESLTKENTEASGEFGNDFSMNVAKSWENTFYSIPNPNTRKVALRTGIVLGKKGGAFTTLKTLATFGLGGKHASGKQKISWIHELDFARAIMFLINNNTLKDSFNISVPHPTNNTLLMRAIRKAIGIPFGINHPKFLLEFGAKLLRTETELVLKSRNVIPKRLLDHGFTFLHEDIDTAIHHLIQKKS